MRKAVLTLLLILSLVIATVAGAANTEKWINPISKRSGLVVPAPGIKLTEHADPPTHADLDDGVIYADTDNNLYYRAGGAWVDLTVQAGGSLTLDGAFDNGKIINGANSSGNAVQIGDGTDAILFHTEGAGDVRMTTNGTSDLTIAPDGGDTDVTGTLDISGAGTVGGTLGITGNLAVNTNKFTVTASSGNALVGGTLNVTGTSTFADAIAVSSGGAGITGGLTVDAATVSTGNLTVQVGDIAISAGELDITGNASNTDTVDLTRSNSASGGDMIDIDMGTAAIAGDAIDISFGGAGTGDGMVVNMANNVAGKALSLSALGARTSPLVYIDGSGTDAGTDDDIIQIVQSGSLDSDIINLSFITANSPGNAINIDMDANLGGEGVYIDEGAGARTGSAIEVNADGTGTHSVIDMNVSGAGAITGLDIQGSYNGSPAGDAIKVTLDDGDNLDTGLINLSVGTGNRSALIKYASTGTDSGTTSHVIDIDQTGVLDSDIINITYDTGTSTGQAIGIHMGTNVAGMAVLVDTSATGVADEGAGLDIDADGALVQGANLLRVDSSGNMAHADCRLVELNETGADQASSYVLDVNSTNNGGIAVAANAADNAIDIESGFLDLSGNKMHVFDSATGIYGQADTYVDMFADGGMRFGDSSAGAPTNYSMFGPDGSYTATGTARRTKKVWLGSEVFWDETNATAAVAGTGFKSSWEMTDGAADYITASWYIPDNWVSGTDISVYIHWSSTAGGANVGTWDLHYVALAAGEDVNGAGTNLADFDDTSAGNDLLNITDAFTVANGDIAAGDQIVLRPGRIGGAANDTLEQTADFLGVQISYTANTW